MKGDTLPSLDLISSIRSMRPQAKMLLNKGKEYDVIITEILKDNYYSEDDKKYPSMKELQSKLNLEYSKLKKLIRELYDDISELIWEDTNAVNLSKVEYEFYIECHGEHAIFRGFLPVCPRLGESLTFHFFKPKTRGMDYYYVTGVKHELTDEKQIIAISGYFTQIDPSVSLQIDHPKFFT